MARPREFDIDDVLTQSMNVFWTQGYKATSMEDLMKATGLNKQSFYCAFGDKRGLFIKALALYRKNSTVMMKDKLAQAESPLQGLEEIFHSMIARCDGGGCMMVNAVQEFGTGDAEIAAETRQMFQNFEKLVADALAQGQKQGEVTTAYPAPLMAKNLVSMLSGLRVMEKRGESPKTLKSILEMSFDAIRPKKPIKV